MATVLFSFYVRPGADADELAQRLRVESASTALADVSVETWSLHRVIDWPGATKEGPAFVAIVEVSDPYRWSEDGAPGIAADEESLTDLVQRIELLVTQPA